MYIYIVSNFQTLHLYTYLFIYSILFDQPEPRRQQTSIYGVV